MSDYTIEEFCRKHGACEVGREWAIANCQNMKEAWDKLPDEYLIWTATRKGVLTDEELRLFSVFCCREIWHLIKDPRSRKAVEAAEKFAHGQASEDELKEARAAALAVARAAARAAARVAAKAAAEAEVAARAGAGAGAAAESAAAVAAAVRTAAETVVAEAEEIAVAAKFAQVAWLRANCKPNFVKIS